jgi:hypothetical protein
MSFPFCPPLQRGDAFLGETFWKKFPHAPSKIFGANWGLSVLRGVRMKFYESYYFFRLSLLLQRKLGKESSFKNPFCERGS